MISYRLSKLILSLNFSMIGSVPPLNRPPAPKSPPREPDAAVVVVVVGVESSCAIIDLLVDVMEMR